MITIIKKIIILFRNNNLSTAVKEKVRQLLLGMKYIISNPSSKIIKLYAPEYITPSDDNNELELVERIFKSYKKIKSHYENSPAIYKPSTMWQNHLDKQYSYLNEALKSNEIDKFHFFLTNFGCWKEYHGIESTTMINSNMKSVFLRR